MKNLTPAELAVVARVDRDRVADDLAALVAIPSLTGDESEVQTEVALRMTTAGLDVERVDTPAIELAADPDFPGVEVARDSHPVVTGRVTGDAAGRRVLIAGHIDVVGAGDEMAWTSPPFQPRIDDGVLFGRGACDMKAGVVAGLAALRAIVEADVELGGEAMLVTVPKRYPYHPGPIDTLFRPRVDELASLFPRLSLVSGAEIRCESLLAF